MYVKVIASQSSVIFETLCTSWHGLLFSANC